MATSSKNFLLVFRELIGRLWQHQQCLFVLRSHCWCQRSNLLSFWQRLFKYQRSSQVLWILHWSPVRPSRGETRVQGRRWLRCDRMLSRLPNYILLIRRWTTIRRSHIQMDWSVTRRLCPRPKLQTRWKLGLCPPNQRWQLRHDDLWNASFLGLLHDPWQRKEQAWYCTIRWKED